MRPEVRGDGGRRFAFLAYNAISGSINAGEGRPGVAWFDMQPYAPDDPRDMAAMKEAVARAKAEADFVVVGFRWSVEYTQQPSSSMRAAAHTACDAGAEMVIGSHPHIIQPYEYYNGSLIAYTLGNFVFDQMWAKYTREGFFLRCRLKGDLLTQVELVPYRICDCCQPNVLEGESGQYLLDRLLGISGIAAE
ncbi:MAG: CapA family protein [Actinomycetota bacterium]|nr:CapA family protein [Actinomycetota bacterium]